jgi:O-antigen ligase
MDSSEAWLPAEILWSVAYVVAFVGAVLDRKAALRLARASLPLVLILLLVVLSVLWSNEPATTARRSVALIGTTVVALGFVNLLGLRGFVESLVIAIGIAAVASVPLIALSPSYGLMNDGGVYDGVWRGCFSEKNDLGQAMVLGILSLAALAESARGVRRGLLIALGVLFLVLLAGSQSAGAIASVAIFALGFPFLLWIRAARSRKVLAPLVIAATFFVAILSGLGTDGLFGLLGRDATLTGRTDVWEATLQAISQRPVLGYGYREFWNPNGDSSYFIGANNDGWLADTAHNGFIEVALDIGFVGEAVLIVALVVGVGRTAKTFWRGNDRLSSWPLCAMLDIIIENLSDRSFATQDSIHWIVFLAAFWFATDDRLRAHASAASAPNSPEAAASVFSVS